MRMSAMMISDLENLRNDLNTDQADILVIGIGNILMGDEGVGVRVIQEMDKANWPDHIRLLDGGTGGFHLLQYLQENEHVIMVDATMDGKAPGSISVLHPKFSSDFPSALTAHDIGLKDLIESVILTDQMPEITLVTISISDVQYMRLELSPDVESSVPEVISTISKLIN